MVKLVNKNEDQNSINNRSLDSKNQKEEKYNLENNLDAGELELKKINNFDNTSFDTKQTFLTLNQSSPNTKQTFLDTNQSSPNAKQIFLTLTKVLLMPNKS